MPTNEMLAVSEECYGVQSNQLESFEGDWFGNKGFYKIIVRIDAEKNVRIKQIYDASKSSYYFNYENIEKSSRSIILTMKTYSTTYEKGSNRYSFEITERLNIRLIGDHLEITNDPIIRCFTYQDNQAKYDIEEFRDKLVRGEMEVKESFYYQTDNRFHHLLLYKDQDW